MPNRKKVESWGFNNLGFECNDDGEVTMIFCKTCCEYYSSNKISSSSSSTFIKAQVVKFVTGTNIIKKSNFSDHVKKSTSHTNAVKGLNQTLERPPDQTSLVTCVRGMKEKLKDQLVMKFQLAHFTAIHGKPFKLYSDIAYFKRDIHNVDLGNSYLTDTSCHEMLTFLSRSIVANNIMKPLNDGTIQYYSVHNDGSSSTKTMDEKELFIIKTAHKGEVKFNVMSLEEPNEANAEGLKLALENSILKLGLIIERKDREVCFVSNPIKRVFTALKNLLAGVSQS